MTENPHPKKSQLVIKRIGEANSTPPEIAGELGLSLEELAEIVLSDPSIRTLKNLARLADVHAQLLLSRYRANTTLQLISIASAREPTELSRRACVDLLKMNLDVLDDKPASPSPPSAPDEKAILDALERLGEDRT